MLQQLSIQNFALIEKLRIEPEEGLNLLTGETGAGKTIVTGALGVLMGGRASAEFIRKGEEESVVEGFFDVDESKAALLREWGIVDPQEGLLLRREISRKGKNRCLINGQMTPLNVYRDVGARLIDIHGQNQEQSLLKADRQLDLLDNYGGLGLGELKAQVKVLWRERKQALARLEELQTDEEETAREVDFLRYQWEEIEKTALVIGEKEQLEKQRTKLVNLEALYRGTRNIHELLSDNDGVLEKLGMAMTEADRVEGYDETLAGGFRELRDAYYVLEEVSRAVRSYHMGLDFETDLLNDIETRLGDIHYLEKKYGGSVEAVLAFQTQVGEKLAQMENREEEMGRWTVLLQERDDAYRQKAALLTEARRVAAGRLGKKMTEVVRQLSLPHAQLEIEVKEATPGSNGANGVTFQFSPNPGEGFSSLARIASGGEVSRVMLAIKAILADADDIGILVFDEVDTGIGGEAIVSVAENLSRLAGSKQVFCVSHAPQLAAFGDCHFQIRKIVDGGRTRTGISKLDEAGRRAEIARMLGGEGNIEGVEEQAVKMLKSAARRKAMLEEREESAQV